jgi:NitT/TauT family transport system substrate-binding protein
MTVDPSRRGVVVSDGRVSRRTLLAWSSAGVVSVLGGGLLAACGGDDEADNPIASDDQGGSGSNSTSRVVELLSTPGPTFTDGPGAVAEEMGFYRDDGIELSVEYPGNSVRALQTLVGGTGTIASADSFALLVAVAEELDFTSVYLGARGYAFGFAVNGASPIEEWSADAVRGTRIGVTEFAGGEVPVLRGALARMDLAEGDDVELVAIGTGGPETADAIESGSVDIVAASVFDFEIFRVSGVDLRVITPGYIQSFPGHGYATTPDLLESNRDSLVRLLRAKAKGTVFLRANPQAAAEMAIAAAPASAEGMDVELVAGFLGSVYADGNAFAFEDGNPDFHRLGVQDPAAFDDFQQFLIETGSEDDDGTTLSAEVDVEAIIHNDLIEEINDFDFTEIEALAARS